MLRKFIWPAALLALAFVLPAPGFAADAPEAAAPADQQPPEQKPGLMTRFAKLFDRLDTSKPENQHTFVIGGSNPAQPAVPSANKPAAEAAAAPSPNVDPVSVQAKAAEPAVDGAQDHHHFKLSSGFESGDGQKPATDGDTPSPQASTKPAGQTTQ